MDSEREAILGHILSIDRRLYQYLQVARIPDWAGIELTMPQLKVLFLAGGPRPLPTSQVARSLGMTSSTVTGVVDRLVAQGLIQRLEDPTDRRIVLLQATPEGAALLDRLLRAGLAHFRDILDRLSLEELRVVARALDLLHEAAMSLESREPSAISHQLSASAIGGQASAGVPGGLIADR